MSYIENAKKLKAAMDAAGTYLTDAQALTVKAIYSSWDSLIGTTAKVGQRFRHGDTLFKVRTQHTFSREWIPGVNTASLYTAIDVEHTGTIDDPIPWVQPMELVSGKYYVDAGVLYICTRDSGMPLAYALAELVGTYVEVVE
jgi:hypothetical protein